MIFSYIYMSFLCKDAHNFLLLYMSKSPTEKEISEIVSGNMCALTISKVYLNYILQLSNSVTADLAIEGDVFQVQLFK